MLELHPLALSIEGKRVGRLDDGSGRRIQASQLKVLKYLLERPNVCHSARAIAFEASPDAEDSARAIGLHVHWLRVALNDGRKELIRTRASHPDEEVRAYGLFAAVENVTRAEIRPDTATSSQVTTVEPTTPAEIEMTVPEDVVTDAPTETWPTPPAEVKPVKQAHVAWLPWVAGTLLVAVSLSCFCLIAWKRLSRDEPRPRQITTNSAEYPVKVVAVSPDASYIAYAEKTGEGEKTNCKLWHRSNNLTESLPALRDSEIFRLSWFDADTLLVSGKVGDKEIEGVWMVPILGGSERPFKVPLNKGEVGEAAASDRSHVAFVGGDRNELWVTDAGGQEPRLILQGERGDEFRGLTWLAGGRRLLFDRLHLAGTIYQITVETINVDSGQTSVVIQDNPQLRAGCASPNGRLYYAVEYDPPEQNDTSLWEMDIDPATGSVTGAPNMVAKSTGAMVYGLSTDASGDHLVLLKGPYQADVWVGDFDPTNGSLSGMRRLTHDDSNDLPTAWTPDGRAVFFHSNRGGRYAIYKKDLGGAEAERIVYGDEDYRGARVSPEGELFYLARRGDWQQNKTDSVRLKVAAADGSNPRVVYERYALLSVRCPRAPGRSCVMGQQDILSWPNAGELVFRDLTREGPGRELRRISGLPLGQEYWDVSPDGSLLAVVIGGKPDATIRVLGLDGTSKDVVVKGHSGFQSLDWTPDGRGWYVSSRSARSADLLYVDLNGNSRVLWESADGFETWGVPSPDGSHLAVLEWTVTGNVWLIDEPSR